MKQQDESAFIGLPTDQVPKKDPDDYCNAKKTKRDDEGNSVFAGYCRAQAGKGTDHFGEGRCKHHGGAIKGGGAPDGNQNRATHALYSDPQHYYRSLSSEEKAFIHEMSQAICRRLREQRDKIDSMDWIMARRIAIELHIVAKANHHVEEIGLTQTIRTEFGSRETSGALLEEIRKRDRAIFRMLDKLGVLDNPRVEDMPEWQETVEIMGHE